MVLYKYLAPSRLDVLEERRIRFTQPAAFNDRSSSAPVSSLRLQGPPP